MKRFHTITLGCKVNQCESVAINQLLAAAGLAPARGQTAPDVVVINTCTVTGKAAMQCRQAVRQAIRKHPSARIVVTGCYAQTAPEEIRSIQGVDLIVGHLDKMRLGEIILAADPRLSPLGPMARGASNACAFSALPALGHGERTRAFLKIQDGCNTRCTYCIVPYARGDSRSMPLDQVMTHLSRLGAEDFKEVVLTGIHLGAYGGDLQPPSSLADLLSSVMENRPVRRIRISSIEPTEVDRRILSLLADERGVICRHLHVPLQSGDDTILRRMGRPYTRDQFARVIHDLHERIPAAAIGVDIMAGFPGETEAAFENSYRLIEALPVTYLHVFPFSARKGTPAAGFKPKVPERITKERCKRLRLLGQAKQTAFYRSMVGKCLEVLVETSDGRVARGWSDNYLPVTVAAAENETGENSLITVRITGVGDDGEVMGELPVASEAE